MATKGAFKNSSQYGQYPIYYKSLSLLPSWMVRVLFLSTPVFVMIQSKLFLGTTITKHQIYGMLLVMGGGGVIILKGKIMAWLGKKIKGDNLNNQNEDNREKANL